MTFGSVLQAGILLIAVMMAVGLFVLFYGIAREANAWHFRHLADLSPGARRMVRWQSWTLRYLPGPLLAGFTGTYVLVIGALALDPVTGGLAFRIYVAPAALFDSWLGSQVPRAALYFWGVGIAAGWLWRGSRKGGVTCREVTG